MKYGDAENPLLLSCRSGARKSMPGMMETVLNVGLCPATIPGLVKKSGSERFVYDAYRRLIMMYSDVVMEKAEDIEPAEGKGIRVQLEHIMASAEEVEEVHVRHRHDGRGPEEALRGLQEEGAGGAGPPVPRRSAGAALGGRRRRVQELAGPPRRFLPQDRGHSRRSGAPPATCRAWSSATWATPRPPAWPSAATRPPARTSSTANGWSMPRARTWWPASARPIR